MGVDLEWEFSAGVCGRLFLGLKGNLCVEHGLKQSFITQLSTGAGMAPLCACGNHFSTSAVVAYLCLFTCQYDLCICKKVEKYLLSVLGVRIKGIPTVYTYGFLGLLVITTMPWQLCISADHLCE